MPKKQNIRQVKPILLPPAPHLCQECAVAHAKEEPHDASSFFYRTKFMMENDGRTPTWLDAVAHCPKDIKENWLMALEINGVNVKKV